MDREKVIYGLCKAIGALRALKNKFPSTEEDVEPGIQACIEAKELLKEQEKEIKHLKLALKIMKGEGFFVMLDEERNKCGWIDAKSQKR